MVRVGFIGLGDMGGPMVHHLANDGHAVTAFDVDDEALAAADDDVTPAASGLDAVDDAEVVFLSLPDPQTVEHVVEEIADTISPGAVLVDTTTSIPSTTRRVVELLETRDIDMLGAPISGGKYGAQAATLSVMVGGDEAVYEACEPLFRAFATDCFHVGGEPGHGHAVKLLNNFVSYTGLLAACEAVVVGELAGIDPDQLVGIFSASSGRNSATEDKIPNQVLTGEYNTGFPLALTEKDIRLYTELTEELGTPSLLGNVTRSLIGYARSMEGGDGDMTRVYDFLEGASVLG